VTFRVQKREKVTYSYGRMPLKPLPTLEEVLGDAQGFLGFLLPYRGKMLVERRSSPRRFAGPIMGLDRLKLALRTLAWKTGARPFMLPRVLPWRIRRRLIWLYVAVLERGLDLFFLSALGRFASYRADAMIDFRRPAASYFDFTFWAFPVDQWDRIVPAYLDFCERFRRETGFRPALPTEVYFIRRDDSALLSFCPDQDIFTLDMVNWSDEEPACWAAMNRAFNEFAADHGGRPLLNQTKQLLPKVARRLWNERWETLGKQRRECDPHGRFLTPFLAGIVP